ncbi:MAG: hypothetical protein ACO2ZK_04920 [Gemmobacter sp.]
MTTDRQTPAAPAPPQGTRTPVAPQGRDDSPRQQGGETGAPRISDWASI